MLVAQLAVYFVDTGIQVTTNVAHQIHSGIPDTKATSAISWSLPCNSTFPITLRFAGRPFTMYERDTIVKQVDGTCTVLSPGVHRRLARSARLSCEMFTHSCRVPCMVYMSTVVIFYLTFPIFFRHFSMAKGANGSVTFIIGFAHGKIPPVSTYRPPRTSRIRQSK